MKCLRHFCAAAVLICALAFPAFAGDMDYPIAPPPQQQTVAGEMDHPIISDINPLSELTRSFINVLSAF